MSTLRLVPPTDEELLYLKAGIGPCEGTFDPGTIEEGEIYNACTSLVKRGLMEWIEWGENKLFRTTTKGAELVKSHEDKIDNMKLEAVRKGTQPIAKRYRLKLVRP